MFLFLVYIDYFHIDHNKAKRTKIILFLNFQKNDDQISINFTDICDLWANFQITLGMMKSNGCMALLNILHYILNLM